MIDGVPLDVEERRAYMRLLRRMKKPQHLSNREIVSAGIRALEQVYPEQAAAELSEATEAAPAPETRAPRKAKGKGRKA